MKKLLILAVLAVVLLSLPVFSEGKSEASKQEVADLLFWAVHTRGPELEKATQALVDKFMGEHPNIKVKYEQVSGQVVYPKFLTAVRGGDMPDVADGYAFHPLQFAGMGQMMPLDDIIDEWKKSGQLKDITREIAYKTFLWDGHYWAVPWALDIRAIYYRKDWLGDAGIQAPTDWNTFRDAVVRTNKADQGIYGLSMPAGYFHISEHFYHMFMVQNGGYITDKQGNLAFGTASKKANVEALTYLTDFYTKHKATPPGIASYNTDETQTVFLQEKSVFLLGTGYTVNRIIKERPDLIDKIGILDTLQGPKAKLTTGFYNPMFIWKDTEYPEEAKTFLKYLCRPKIIEPLYDANLGKMWPVWKSDFNLDVWKQTPQLVELNKKAAPYVVGFNYPGGGTPQMGAIDGEKMFAKPVNDVVAGVATPEEAVMAAHKEMEKLWKK